jgi:homocysteine S-methyltransferase
MTDGAGLAPFTLTVEVVPPAGTDAGPLVNRLRRIASLPFDGFSVATNPVAKPRMSALALSVILKNATDKVPTLHCTTRDHNRLSIQSLLWGAKALDIRQVLVASGDYVALGDRARTTTVRDVDVFELVRMARQAGLAAGVVLDPGARGSGLAHQVRRLELKVEAGAQFAVTQPVFDRSGAEQLHASTRHLAIPIHLGILPLRTARHARFLHQKVSGISVPQHVQDRMDQAAAPADEGISMARELLAVARQLFDGACIMPPFDRYEIMHDLLA